MCWTMGRRESGKRSLRMRPSFNSVLIHRHRISVTTIYFLAPRKANVELRTARNCLVSCPSESLYQSNGNRTILTSLTLPSLDPLFNYEYELA